MYNDISRGFLFPLLTRIFLSFLIKFLIRWLRRLFEALLEQIRGGPEPQDTFPEYEYYAADGIDPELRSETYEEDLRHSKGQSEYGSGFYA